MKQAHFIVSKICYTCITNTLILLLYDMQSNVKAILIE